MIASNKFGTLVWGIRQTHIFSRATDNCFDQKQNKTKQKKRRKPKYLFMKYWTKRSNCSQISDTNATDQVYFILDRKKKENWQKIFYLYWSKFTQTLKLDIVIGLSFYCIAVNFFSTSWFGLVV